MVETNPEKLYWADIGINIPSLLPLQPPPQSSEQVVNYLQALHNYLASDRLKISRALNVLTKNRMLIGTSEQITNIYNVVNNYPTLIVDSDTGYTDVDPGTGDPPIPVVSGWSIYNEIMNEPTGFVDPLSADIGIDGTNFFIEPAATEFNFFIAGVEFIKDARETISLVPAQSWTGTWYIYYSPSGELVLDNSVTLEDIIRDNCIVAIGYSNGSAVVFAARETHGLMPWQVHMWMHLSKGAIWRSGLGLTGFDPDGTGNTDSHAEFDASAGIIIDEDINHSLAAVTSNWYTLYYLSNVWVLHATGAASPVVLSGGVPQYNDVSGVGALAPVTPNQFYLLHIFATNITTLGSGTAISGQVAVLGQNQYLTISAARTGANEEISNLLLTGLPTPEFVPVGTVILQRKGSNAYNSAVRTTDTGDNYVSWLGVVLTPGSPPASHANLMDRDVPDQHPADSISTDVTGFAGYLSATDVDVQTALDTLDDHTHVEADITDLAHFEPADMWFGGYNAGDVPVATATGEISSTTAVENFAGVVSAAVGSEISVSPTVTAGYPTAFEIDVDLSGKADAAHTHSESDITDLDHTDTDAIHDNVAGEINGLTTVTVASDDVILIEDQSDSWNKKKIAASDLLGGGTDADAIHDNVAAEINALTGVTAATDDVLIVEDQSDSWNKKKVTVSSLRANVTDDAAIHDNVAGEINAITAGTVAGGDLLLIEDIDDSNNKKKVTAQSIADLAAAAPAPQTLAATSTVGSSASTSYSTLVNVSSGPYILTLCDSYSAGAAGYFKITIDGTVVLTDIYAASVGVALGVGGAYPLALYARTSLKVEIKRDGASGTFYARAVYQRVGIT